MMDGDSLAQTHLLKIQIFFNTPKDVVVDRARVAQLQHDFSFRFDQFRLQIKAVRAMLHRAVVIAVEMEREIVRCDRDIVVPGDLGAPPG